MEKTILKHAEDNWGATWKDIGLKLGEEAGEVLGCIKRLKEGRGSESRVAEELGDLLFVAAQVAAKLDVTMQDVLIERIRGRHPDFDVSAALMEAVENEIMTTCTLRLERENRNQVVE